MDDRSSLGHQAGRHQRGASAQIPGIHLAPFQQRTALDFCDIFLDDNFGAQLLKLICRFEAAFKNLFFDKLAGTDELRKQMLAGKSAAEIKDSWKKGLEDFQKIRAKYVMYKD